MNTKKGMGLSLNVIIIAIIGLCVLIVLVFIFTRSSSDFATSISDCESMGGSCAKSCSDEFAPMSVECPEETDFCCVRAFKSKEKTDEN